MGPQNIVILIDEKISRLKFWSLFWGHLRFLWLFLALAGLSFLALLSSLFVSDTNPDDSFIDEDAEEEIAYRQTYM